MAGTPSESSSERTSGGLPTARPVDPAQVRDVPHIPAATLAVAIVTFLVSPFVIVLSLFLAMAADECDPDTTCDDVERWWLALNAAAWAMPAIAIVALIGSRAARTQMGRLFWSLPMIVAPVAWFVILTMVPT